MIELQVYDKAGAETSSVKVDEEKLGGKVHLKLLHQAVIMYRANLRQGTASVKNRSQIVGSTRKLYRQKGTGHARAGSVKSPIRRGGGVAFGPKPRNFGYHMPKKALRLATRSALLGKFKDAQVKVVDSLNVDEVKTKQVAELLKSLDISSSCLLITADYNKKLMLSARNLPKVSILPANDLNAYEILKREWLVIEKEAVEKLAGAAS